ncbi:copper amine oxidase N-terminal domain-containing protein [Paenibacillus shenyangensis]|uniref:copper amine oxidase N-terminal domain-containing protein n=1 Tax=Paenibacillus sp. A9 TaxID=1284352 RepID=UPI00036D1810|nr:copper amine oxidase N-terminal domain-containing protein [Paenibacillus sp. A9]
MNKKAWITLALSSALLLPISPASVQAASSPQLILHYAGGGYTSEFSETLLVRNGVNYVNIGYYPSSLGLELKIDASGKRASYNGWNKKFAVRDGSKTAMLDGKIVTMQAPALIRKDKKTDTSSIYVPLRFAAQALDGKLVSPNAQHNTYQINDMHTYEVVTDVYKGTTYTLTKLNGDLYASRGKQDPVKLASIQTGLDSTGMEFRSTPGGLLLITVNDSYGEPHINSQQFQLLFRDGKLVRQTSVDYGWGRSNTVNSYDNKLVMNDGTNLRIIEDGTGKVLQTLNLVELAGKGKDQKYSVEAIDQDMLLIRNARDHQLQLINRKNGNSVLLYQQFLTHEQQQGVEEDIGPMSGGDRIDFTKRVGNTLYFTYADFDKGTVKTTYNLDKLD